jgi:hypothetical protein
MAVIQSPAYLMYPDDILASGRVNSLEPLEELWYRRAIDLGWKNGGMPADPCEFAGWVGRGCTVEAAAKIIAKLYVPHKKDPTKVVNERQEKERKLFFKKRKKKSDAGKLGMAKRWSRKGKDDNTVITEDNIPISISIPTTSNEVEKKEETPQAAKAKRGTRLPDTFLLTSEMRSWGIERRPDVDLITETEKFCNHWRSSTGRNAVKLDWLLTWKNWILNAKGNGINQKHNAGPGRPTNEDRLAETFDVINQYPTETELGNIA